MRRVKVEKHALGAAYSASCGLPPDSSLETLGQHAIGSISGGTVWGEMKRHGIPASWLYAVERTLQDGQHVAVLSMLDQAAEHLLEQGDLYLLDSWFAALQQHMLCAKPLLQIVAAWVTCFVRGPWVMMQRFDIKDWADNGDPVVRGHVNAIRQLTLAVRERTDEAYIAGLEGATDVPTMNPFADVVLLSMTIRMAAALGEYEQARVLICALQRLSYDASLYRMYARSIDGILALRQGRLRQASSHFRAALSSGPIGDWRSYTGDRVWCATLYATVLYEENEVGAVEHLLNFYPATVREACTIGSMLTAYRIRIRLAFLCGGDRAFRLISELEYYGERYDVQCAIVLAKMERARLWLLEGKVEEAGEELASIDSDGIWKNAWRFHFPTQEAEDLSLALLRYKLYSDEPMKACQHIFNALESAISGGLPNRVIKLRVLLALAYERSGASDKALDAIARAVLDASKEGFVRSILDEGLSLMPLIDRLHIVVEQGEFGANLSFAEHVRKLQNPCGLGQQEGQVAAPVFNAVTSQFTRREIRVLQLLAQGYSNGAMARSLFVSDSTVRTHLRSINSKLGARSRTHAVALARDLGVID
ncbi:helix-turn-helix transcriptional regulator [Paraburkholderia kururiensis]|uniref:helix-turn-helix transcriptional regulator n=1 Tax=Paraburkholderia kururiensis TaxID=984307 RepID=UPI0018F43617|nr:LuxR C-terminal-related transcriptional regulator [Paraburkholderia kururiensis]